MQGYQLPNGQVIGGGATAVSPGLPVPTPSALPVPNGIPMANVPSVTGMNPLAGMPSTVSAPPTAQPTPLVTGAIPRAVVPNLPPPPVTDAVVPQIPAQQAVNPMASGGYSVEDARKFLSQGR